MPLRTAGLLCVAVALLVPVPVAAALPIRKPDVEAVVEKTAPATEAERKNGVLLTVFLKGRKVPVVEADDIKADAKVSVWIDAKTGRAEAVLIFP
jgi:hypothetical protein